MFEVPIFISAVSKELKSFRLLVEQSLQKRGYRPVFQELFELTDQTIDEMLQAKIGPCSAVVCLIGHRYGAEPSQPLPGQPRRSYTQMEYFFAKHRKIPVYRFLTQDDGHPTPDQPHDETPELRALQEAYRQEATQDRDWRAFASIDQLRAEIAELKFPWERYDASLKRPEQHRPYLTNNFTGRADEITELLDQFERGVTQLGFVSSLKGTGGVGKTTLAALIAERLYRAGRLPAGVLWSNLRDEPPHVAAQRWLSDLGESAAGDLSPDAYIAKFHEVAGRRQGLLVVLDNAQPPRWGVCDADRLLVKAPGVYTLITTRFQEAIPDGIPAQSIDKLTDADAKALLRNMVGPDIDKHPAAVDEIVKLCDHLPLFLKTAGRAVKNKRIPLTDYARMLRAQGLAVLGRHDPQAAAVFDLTWEHLTPAAREIFTVFAFVPSDTFGVNLASAWFKNDKRLADEPSLPEQTLGELDNASLLIPAGDRYRYHDRARDYGRLQIEKLGDKVADLETKVKQRLMRCWCDWDFVKAEFDSLGAHGLSDEYRLLREWGVAELKEFAPWYHFVRRDATLFAASPDLFVAYAAREAVGSPVARAALPVYQREHAYWVEWRNRPEKFIQPACLQILRGHTDAVTAVSVTADGRLAVSGSMDGTGRVWDLVKGTPGLVLKGHSESVFAVSVTADGRRAVSGSRDKTVRVWDLVSGTRGPVLRGHTGSVDAVSVTPDGRLAVSGSNDKTVRMWDLVSGTPGRVLQGHTQNVTSVSVTADGCLAVSGSLDKTVRVWDLVSGTPGLVFKVGSPVYAVNVTADGRLAVLGHWGRTVRVWDLANGTPGPVLHGHTSFAHAVSVTADGRRAISGSDDKTVRVWDLASGTPGPVLQGHTRELTSVSVTADGRGAVSGSRDMTVRVWDLVSSTPNTALDGNTSNVNALSVTADGRLAVSGHWDMTVRAWDLVSGAPGPVLQGHTQELMSVSVAADGRRAVSGSFDKTVRVWDLVSGAPGPVFQGHTAPVIAVSVTADGRRAVSGSGTDSLFGSDNTVRVWDLSSGTPGPVLQGHTAPVTAVSVTADGRRAVSGSSDKTVRVWDLEKSRPGPVLQGHSNVVTAVRLATDGRRAVSTSDNTVRVWDLDTGRCLATHPEGSTEARQAWYMTEPARRVWLFQVGHFLVYRAAPSDEILARFPGTFSKFACGHDGVNALAFDRAHQPYFLRLHRGAGEK